LKGGPDASALTWEIQVVARRGSRSCGARVAHLGAWCPTSSFRPSCSLESSSRPSGQRLRFAEESIRTTSTESLDSHRRAQPGSRRFSRLRNSQLDMPSMSRSGSEGSWRSASESTHSTAPLGAVSGSTRPLRSASCSGVRARALTRSCSAHTETESAAATS